MRQIVLDTETTGLEPEQGHRIIEIGCVEMINRRLSDSRMRTLLVGDDAGKPRLVLLDEIHLYEARDGAGNLCGDLNISSNTIENCTVGIFLDKVNGVEIADNGIGTCSDGIIVNDSGNVQVYWNSISGNHLGLDLGSCTDLKIFHSSIDFFADRC